MNRIYLLCSVFVILAHLFCSSCYAGDWRSDFERLCGKTETAEKMTVAELSELIVECDMVEADIKKSADPDKKLYLFRVKKCRNFYMFMKETKSRNPG